MFPLPFSQVMTPDQIQELAKQIAAHGIPPKWEEWALLLALMIAGAAVSAWVGAFYAKRGEIRAMDRSLKSLITQTAELTKVAGTINSNLSRLDWVEQKKWEIKQKFYWDTLARLNKMQSYLEEMATLADFYADTSKRLANLKAQAVEQDALVKKFKSRKKTKRGVDDLTSSLVKLETLKVEVATIQLPLEEKFSRFKELESLRYATAMELLSETTTANVFIAMDVLLALDEFARQRPKMEQGKPFAKHIRDLQKQALSLHTNIVSIARGDLKMVMHSDKKGDKLPQPSSTIVENEVD